MSELMNGLEIAITNGSDEGNELVSDNVMV